MYFTYADFSRANWSAAERECGSVEHMAVGILGIGNKNINENFTFDFPMKIAQKRN